MTNHATRQAPRTAFPQVVSFAALAALTSAMVCILMPESHRWFEWIFGQVHPMMAVGLATIVGAPSLVLLRNKAGFQVLAGRRTLRGLAVAAGFASAFAVVIVIADLLLRYPEDTNVPMPEALMFYPAVGFVAEVAFHLAPLAVLLLVLPPLGERHGRSRTVTIAIVVTALVESAFQVAFAPDPLAPTTIWTAVHVTGFALAQLHLFRRYDFVTMYGLRIIYYGYWHILWGVIRLEVLF